MFLAVVREVPPWLLRILQSAIQSFLKDRDFRLENGTFLFPNVLFNAVSIGGDPRVGQELELQPGAIGG